MGDRHVALRDRDEAREASFRGEEVVPTGIECAVGDSIPDRQQLARGIEEEAEVHGLDHRLRTPAEDGQTIPEGLGHLEVADMARDRGAQRLGPDQDVRLSALRILLDERPRVIPDRVSVGRQRREP